ncbi:MAG: DEAD/DEAH box helicase [Candidatus Nanopelagicales bacterium]
MDAFSEPTRAWFRGAFTVPTEVQARTWREIQAGRNVLAVAPTGSGKTLAAFLWAIDRCLRPRTGPGVRVLYVSPLKALAVDVQRNLRAPLAGIAHQAVELGLKVPEITVASRTGDTPAQERRSMARHPPDVLITTPESLFLVLTSAAREILTGVETVVVDEVHALAGTKRGAHLAVSLARLDRLASRPIQRIGLSATVRPTEIAARFLGGDQPVEVVNATSVKRWDLQIQVPVEDMGDLAVRRGVELESANSIWPHVEHRIVELITRHRSTIVFANSRRLAERLTARLNEIHAEQTGAPSPSSPPRAGTPAEIMAQSGASSGAAPTLARAHHGSVSKEQRASIEHDLKSGRLRAVVATSSLELGIDMGAVDLVIQVEAPPSVASGLQRVGRSGHQVDAVSRGVVLPKYRSDLLASAVVVQRMRTGEIEELRVPTNPLDVAAQQVVACVAMDDWGRADLLALLRSTAHFATLTDRVFDSVLDMLAGRYPSDAFAELRPRLAWDREADLLRARPGAQRLAVTSGGTIPDRGLFGVYLIGGGRVGELDEEMVYESRVGDSFALGSSTWQIADITHDRVLVAPAPGAPGRLPFWKGDMLGRPAELGAAIGRFTGRLAGQSPDASTKWLGDLGLDPLAAKNLVDYVAQQLASTGHLPTDRTLVVERTRDELGDWRIAVLSPFGARVHAPWALLVRERLAQRFGVDAAVMHGDEGIVARLPDTAEESALAGVVGCLFPEPDEVVPAVTRLIGGSALFSARFRECAARALLLPRRRPGHRAPLWQQRQRASQLLQIAAEHPTFPIVLETVRECLHDEYDLPALTSLIDQVHRGSIQVVETTPPAPSPFARSLLFGYVAEFLYEGDVPLAERRATALTLDPSLLGELLGQPDLRDLLDPQAISDVVEQLQRLSPDRHARTPEEAVDLLRHLGPLTATEAQARGIDPQWLGDLETDRRLFRTRFLGEDAWACVEDASRLRDGLGVGLPLGLPAALLQPVPDPVGDVVARYSRTHGPFADFEAAGSLGLPIAVVRDQLARALAAGRLLQGHFVPGTADVQWCHPEVLRMVKRRSVARLRRQAEPVPQRVLAAFLPRWHHVQGSGAAPLRGVAGVLEALHGMTGVPVAASALESSILPARVLDYAPALLDQLTATGEVVWTGAGSLPGSDGWVVLAPSELAFLLPRAANAQLTAEARGVLALLEAGGGWFFEDLVRHHAAQASTGAVDRHQLAEALMQLLWAGLVGNDTLGPIRALLAAPRGHDPHARPYSIRAPHGRYASLWRGPYAPPGRVAPSAGENGTASGRSPDVRVPQQRLAGRWFAIPPPAVDGTAMAVSRAEAALLRLAVVSRGGISSSGEPGGFAAAYRTLTALEERGRVQRVYAVEGLGAAQFALTGVVDAVRSTQRDVEDGSPVGLVLASSDPANAYGAALEWPPSNWSGAGAQPHRPSRSAGSHVVLVGGRLVLFVERGGTSLLSFGSAGSEGTEWAARHPSAPQSRSGARVSGAEDQQALLEHAARALLQAVSVGRVPPLRITRINGSPVVGATDPQSQAVAAALIVAGMEPTPQGFRARH